MWKKLNDQCNPSENFDLEFTSVGAVALSLTYAGLRKQYTKITIDRIKILMLIMKFPCVSD